MIVSQILRHYLTKMLSNEIFPKRILSGKKQFMYFYKFLYICIFLCLNIYLFICFYGHFCIFVIFIYFFFVLFVSLVTFLLDVVDFMVCYIYVLSLRTLLYFSHLYFSTCTFVYFNSWHDSFVG